ncbi:aldehyde oxidoreductase [Paracoccidioides lutzii Pb01]|uniref:xanthine dehydrogenase n=1 Tax=Paracoccidioides lutzii (strain ATCC MYA-826 / Pb01) TaxID=502779 RepID=C1GVU5_PARBA|nr:aldehyde oxidoreductase [Paracoccidioides lutzii Pb01]EEH40664.2 aldehyde oxidoreductase [Paracoccidioides lutzii Pb01]
MSPLIIQRPDSSIELRHTPSLASVTESYDDTLRFYLNGIKVVLENPDPEVTLLEYLRGVGLTGTKLGCAEGGCGACTVVISQLNQTTKQIYHASVNACLAPLVSVDGKHVITVEGIGDVKSPHAVQQRMAVGNGSQCGFCTPGIVMSLYALLRNDPVPSEFAIEEAFDGNLCRCTGYRSILDVAQSFSCGKATANGGSGCCMEKISGGDCKDRMVADGTTTAERTFDSPDFIPYSPGSELIFPPSLHKFEFKPLTFGNKKKRWYRPVTLQQLLEIKDACPSAKIIGGSTETQIETKFKAMKYVDSIYVGDIPELKQYAMTDDYLELGANVSLTDLETICDEAVKRYGPIKGQAFVAIKKQIRYFAGRQIRNVASPAGNIVTASPISDLNPVFVATNTVLVAKSLEGDTEIPMGEFFKGYRSTALAPNAVVALVRIPVGQESGEYLRAYKQSKRKDDDIAIVNATLRVSLSDSKTVTSANLVYGGMAPTTAPAKQTQAYLLGKDWTDLATLEGAMDALERDFILPSSVPGGMPTYRKTLALGFFYRFYHDVLSNLKGAAVDEEVIPEIEREISSGRKDHAAAEAYEKKILGKEVPHVSALKQTTGLAQYTDDIPPQHNELYGCLVLSTKARAKLIRVDFQPALNIPGVVEYVDHTCLPNPEVNWWGHRSDEQFLAVDEVFTAGQPIGMVLACSARIAEAGSRAVRIEYEELPAVLTIEEAIEAKSFFDHHKPYIQNGDPEAAFAAADHVFTGVSRIGGQEHFYLETQACVAIPKPEDGEMEIWSSTQNPKETQEYVAKVTGVASNKIVSRVKRLGGGFGGKEFRSIQLAAICAVAASKTKRPVRCMLNRDEDIVTSGQRHPFLCHWKVGVSKEGKLLALDADVYANAGHTLDLSAAVVDRCLSHIDGVYRIPNVHVRGHVCRTNTVSNTAFRGFGGPQGLFFAETYMSEIADHLNIPVEKLQEMNMYKRSDKTHFNQELDNDWYVPHMYQQVMVEADYDSRRAAITEYNRTHKWSKRGLAIVPTKFGISFTAAFLNQAGALVHLYNDGSVLVAHGGTEMGQGLHTKITMIAAEALGVPQSDVHISETATNAVANTSPTAASASSDLNGYAVFNACEQLNQRLQPYREKIPNATMKQLVNAAYLDRVNLSANGFYKTPEIAYKWGENKGLMFYYFTQGVTAAEVHIDTLTGDWTPLRADIKMDVGRSINPAIDYGQIEGAFIQGQGLFTTEESLWHRASGQLFTRGPGTYKIPGFRDIPQVFNVSLLKDVQWENLRTIQRSRGVGEPPLFMGSAVFFAIRDALKAARKQWGVEHVLSLVSPATPERIRISCCDPIVERSRVEDKGDGFFVAI